MVWPFGKKKQGQEPQPEPQGPDFGGALRSVAGFVIGRQRGYLALQGLPRCRVTEEELIEWVRSGEGRDLLSVREWGRLAAAELGGLSEVAGDVVRELEGEVVEESREVLDLNSPKNDNQLVINQLLAQQPELTELAKLNAMLQQDSSSKNQNFTSFTHSNPTKTTPQPQLSTSRSSARPDPSHIKPEAIELFNRGGDCYQSGDLMGAIDLWSQAIDLDPNFANAYYNRGTAYNYLKRYEEAIADYIRAIDIDPNFAYAYNGRGIAYKNLKRYEEAIADHTRAIELDPNDANAYYNRGNAHKDLKRYE